MPLTLSSPSGRGAGARREPGHSVTPRTEPWRRRSPLPRLRRDDARELEVGPHAPLEHLVLGLRGLRQAVDLDEPLRRRRVVLVPLLVGRQLVPVEAVLALAADDHGVPL